MPKSSLTIRQIELDNWVLSRLDVEEYAWLLESAGAVENFLRFLDNIVNGINNGYKPNKKELGVCQKLGLIGDKGRKK
ncbi:MAG TPA: hypothetical protein VLH35_01360 [Candidatus Acidoferrales bacterium]|nr:hypothetical protein [Candidatus Acidoferrales bacterium]